MFKPWSVVDNDELKALRKIAKEATELKRGCDCEYDYRCGRCQDIIDIREKAEKALNL